MGRAVLTSALRLGSELQPDNIGSGPDDLGSGQKSARAYRSEPEAIDRAKTQNIGPEVVDLTRVCT